MWWPPEIYRVLPAIYLAVSIYAIVMLPGLSKVFGLLLFAISIHIFRARR